MTAIISGKTIGKKKTVPRANAYVVTVNGSYLVRSLFPTIEQTAQQVAERITKIQPIRKVSLDVMPSFDICENMTAIAPKNERAKPADFLNENFSFKKIVERIAIKITFVLIKTAEVDAVVQDIPIN